MKFIKLYFLFIFIFSTYTRAQYNKTYHSSLSSNFYETTPIDIIDGGNSTKVVLNYSAMINPITGASTANLVNLRKFDFNGNVVFNLIDSVTDGNLYPKKVIKTPSDDYIIVGLVYYNESPNFGYWCPFAIKYDNNGVRIWSKIYSSSAFYKAQYNINLARIVSIQQVQDDVDESYIIVGPADGDYPVSYDADCLTNAFRIDANGNVIWNKKYGYSASNRFSFSNYFETIMDYPSCITYGNDGSTGKYFIAGGNEIAKFMVTDYNSYFFSIDKNGNIVDPYTIYSSPRYSFGYNGYFDNKTNRFLLTYTMGNNNLEPLPTVSQITVSQFDFLGLNHYSTDYYFNDSATENYAFYLTENFERNAYLISAWHVVNDEFALFRSYFNASLLSLDQTTMMPNFYHRYNIDAVSQTYGHIALPDPSNSFFRYPILAEKSYLSPSTVTKFNRLITTDDAGLSCGVVFDDIIHRNLSLTFTPKPYDQFILSNISRSFHPTICYLIDSITDCDTLIDPHLYRKLLTDSPLYGDIADISVLPTLVESGVSFLNIGVEFFQNSTINVSIYSMDGRCLTNRSFEYSSGLRNFRYDISSLDPGVYIAKIILSGTLISKSIKFTKL